MTVCKQSGAQYFRKDSVNIRDSARAVRSWLRDALHSRVQSLHAKAMESEALERCDKRITTVV